MTMLPAFFAAGLLVGAVHFALLRWNTALYTGGGSVLAAACLQLARLIILAGVLWAVALHGASPLLFTALGVFAARFIVVRVATA